jgi:hypothetical protein
METRLYDLWRCFDAECPHQKPHSYVFCSRRSFYDYPSPSDSRRIRWVIALNVINRPSEWHVPVQSARRVVLCSGGDAFVAMVESANLRDFHDPTSVAGWTGRLIGES